MVGSTLAELKTWGLEMAEDLESQELHGEEKIESRGVMGG